MQVFISYGRKSNGELLLSYGFVPREGTNPSDSVELSLSLKKSDKCYKEKLEALKKHGLSVYVLIAGSIIFNHCSSLNHCVTLHISVQLADLNVFLYKSLVGR